MLVFVCTCDSNCVTKFRLTFYGIRIFRMRERAFQYRRPVHFARERQLRFVLLEPIPCLGCVQGEFLEQTGLFTALCVETRALVLNLIPLTFEILYLSLHA